MKVSGLEQGVLGNTILATDPGDPDPWDFAVVPASSVLVYDNAQLAHGGRAAKIQPVGGTTYVGWNGTFTTHFGRFYVFPAAAGTTRNLMRVMNGATLAAAIRILPGLKFGLSSSTGTSTSTSGSFAVGQWYRIEYKVIHDTISGQVQIRIYSLDSTTILETLTSAATWNTLASGTAIHFGVLSTTTEIYYLDEIVADAVAYPGPWTPPVSVPQKMRPRTVISRGQWVNEIGGSTNLVASINESSPNDATFVQSSSNPEMDTLRILLDAANAPGAGTSTMRIRYKRDQPVGSQTDFIFRLLKGNTEILRKDYPNISTLLEDDIVLAPAELAAFGGDFSNVQAELIGNSPTASALIPPFTPPVVP
jgi:hypothetical protein